MRGAASLLCCLLLLIEIPLAGAVGTGPLGNAGVRVQRGQYFATMITFPAESGQKADSLVLRFDDDFTAPDSVIGVIYEGTSGDITNRLYLSTDTIAISTTSGTPSRRVLRFAESATLTSGAIYYPGIQVLGGGSPYIYADTVAVGVRTAKDSTSTPPITPWSLSEFTSIAGLACSLYYSAVSGGGGGSGPRVLVRK